MDYTLLTLRLKSFGYEALSLFLTALVGVLASDDFAYLITSNFGETLTTSIALLAVTGVVKHLRNLRIIKTLGAKSKVDLI